MNIKEYAKFQKQYYQSHSDDPDNKVVGNYAWHEQFPYETFLCYKNGDLRLPVLDTFEDKVALDFGCGPGRMVKRMSKIFAKVDGVDISENLLIEAKRRNPNSDFYESSGYDLGSAPSIYDFIFCTISMQHISARQTRLQILKSMKEKLKPGGKITLQMAFVNNNNFFDNKTPNAKYLEDKFDTITTNGGQDVVIMPKDLEQVRNDFNSIFNNTKFWFYDVSLARELNGIRHGDYWATHWIFIHAER